VGCFFGHDIEVNSGFGVFILYNMNKKGGDFSKQQYFQFYKFRAIRDGKKQNVKSVIFCGFIYKLVRYK